MHNDRQHNRLVLLLLINRYSGDQIKKDEMGGACGMCGGEKRYPHGFGGKPEQTYTIWRTMV